MKRAQKIITKWLCLYLIAGLLIPMLVPSSVFAADGNTITITLFANNENAWYVHGDEVDPITNTLVRYPDFQLNYYPAEGSSYSFDQWVIKPYTEEGANLVLSGWSETANGKLVDLKTYVPKDGSKLYAIWNRENEAAYDDTAEAAARAKAEAEAKAKIEAKTKAAMSAYQKAVGFAKNKITKKPKAKAQSGKKAKVTWKAVSGSSGYEIQYGLKKSFKKSKTITVKGGHKKKAQIKKLKAGKKYFIRIRPFTNVTNTSGKTEKIYGRWSKVMKIKVKK